MAPPSPPFPVQGVLSASVCENRALPMRIWALWRRAQRFAPVLVFQTLGGDFIRQEVAHGRQKMREWVGRQEGNGHGGRGTPLFLLLDERVSRRGYLVQHRHTHGL